MSELRNRCRRRGPRSADTRGIACVSKLREQAFREQIINGCDTFADPTLHRLIVNKVFLELILSGASESMVAIDFWKAYKFLLEGGSIFDLTFESFEYEKILPELHRLVTGESVSLELEYELTADELPEEDKEYDEFDEPIDGETGGIFTDPSDFIE